MATEGASIGTVFVDVEPRALAFWQRFVAQAKPGANQAGDLIGAAAGKAIQDKIAAGIDKGINEGARTGGAKGTKAGEDYGGKFADTARKRIEAALKNLPTPQIGVATSEADQKLKDLRAQLADLSGKRIGIDVDEAAALADIDRIQAELAELATESPSARVRVDTAGAAAELAKIQAEISRVDGQTATVDVDVDTSAATAQLAAVGTTSLGSVGGIQALTGAGALIAPAIIPAAAAAAAALAGIGTAALAGVAGIGVGVLAISGVAGAVKNMSAAQEEASGTAATMANRQAQIAGAADQVRSAEAALANTRASAAEAHTRATQRVGDAERSLTAAQQAALNAQRALTDARKAAAESLEDLDSQVANGALSQRRANQQLAEAEKTLASATGDKRADAQLAYDEAKQQVLDLGVRQRRAVAEQADAHKAGVAGSEQVRRAQDNIAQAQRRVADAERGVGEARQAAATQARQSAFQIAQAQQAVISAQRSLQAATTTAGVSGSAAMDKLRQSMAALSPEGQRFALFIFGLQAPLLALRRTAEAGLLPGLQAGITALLPLLPQINAFIGAIAATLGEMAANAGRALAGPQWRAFFEFLSATAAPNLRLMGEIAGNVALGFANLLVAFGPLTAQFGAGLLEMTQRFAEWSAGLAQDEGFKRFLVYVIENGPKLVTLFEKMVVVAFKLIVALAPLGGAVLDTLVVVFDTLAGFDPGILLLIAGGIAGIGVALAIAFGANPVGLIIIAFVAFAAAIQYAWTHCETFRSIVLTVFDAVATGAKWLWENVLKPTFQALADFWNNVLVPAALWLWHNVLEPAFNGIAAVASWLWNTILKPVFEAISWVITNIVAPIFLWLWHHVIEPAWAGIKLAIEIAWTFIQIIFGLIEIFIKVVLVPIFLWLWRKITEVWDGISATISWVWDHFIKPVFNAVGDFIRDHVAPVFKKGVEAIGNAWDGLRESARKPVEFVVNQVINPIVRGFNDIARKFGVDTVSEIGGFAAGGAVWGAGTETSDSIPALLSRDEHVWTAEEVRNAGGHGVIQHMRHLAKHGALPAFAGGGIVDWITNPVGTARAEFQPLLSKLSEISHTDFGRMMAEMPRRIFGGILEKVKGWLGFGGFGGPGGAGPGFLPWPSSPGAQRGDTGVWHNIMDLVRASGIPHSFGNAYRHGDPLWHGSGRAIDYMGYNQDALANFFLSMGSRVLELIHTTDAGGYYISRGQRRSSMGRQDALHRNHLHIAMAQGGPVVGGYHNVAGVGGMARHINANALPSGLAVARNTFDDGGWLPPGLSIADNRTGQPEAILNADQWASVQDLAGDGSRRGRELVYIDEFHAHGQDPIDIAYELDWQMRSRG